MAAVKTEAPASSQVSGGEDNAGSIKFSGVIKSAGGSGGGGGGSFGGGGGSGSSGGGSSAPKLFGGSGSSGGSGGGSFVPKALGGSGAGGSSWQTSYNPSTKNPFATKEELHRFHEENELRRKQGIEARDQERKKEEQERLEKQKEEQRQQARKERQDALIREKQALWEQEAREREARFRDFRSAIEGNLDDSHRLQEYNRKDGKKLSLFAKGISLNASSFRKDNELTIAKNTYYVEVIPYYASSGFYDTDNLAERVYG